MKLTTFATAAIIIIFVTSGLYELSLTSHISFDTFKNHSYGSKYTRLSGDHSQNLFTDQNSTKTPNPVLLKSAPETTIPAHPPTTPTHPPKTPTTESVDENSRLLEYSKNTQRRPTIKTGGLAVMILSARKSFAPRAAIRETWAKGLQNVFYFVGHHCPLMESERRWDDWVFYCEPSTIKDPVVDGANMTKTKQRYVKEQENITKRLTNAPQTVVLPMNDTYHMLPRKLKEAYRWVLKNTDAQWFLKADDDIYVDPDGVLRNLQNLNLTGVKYLYSGRIWDKATVNSEGKWKETAYKHKVYPKFAIGSSGHVISRSIAKYIVENMDNLFEYQGEDTSLGIWIDEAPFRKEVKFYHNLLMTATEENHVELCRGAGVLGKYIVIGHKLGPNLIRACHKMYREEHAASKTVLRNGSEWKEKIAEGNKMNKKNLAASDGRAGRSVVADTLSEMNDRYEYLAETYVKFG